jgi:hypothetical protein
MAVAGITHCTHLTVLLVVVCLQDMLTDACASCAPYLDGYAHWGMLQVELATYNSVRAPVPLLSNAVTVTATAKHRSVEQFCQISRYSWQHAAVFGRMVGCHAVATFNCRTQPTTGWLSRAAGISTASTRLHGYAPGRPTGACADCAPYLDGCAHWGLLLVQEGW